MQCTADANTNRHRPRGCAGAAWHTGVSSRRTRTGGLQLGARDLNKNWRVQAFATATGPFRGMEKRPLAPFMPYQRQIPSASGQRDVPVCWHADAHDHIYIYTVVETRCTVRNNSAKFRFPLALPGYWPLQSRVRWPCCEQHLPFGLELVHTMS